MGEDKIRVGITQESLLGILEGARTQFRQQLDENLAEQRKQIQAIIDGPDRKGWFKKRKLTRYEARELLLKRTTWNRYSTETERDGQAIKEKLDRVNELSDYATSKKLGSIILPENDLALLKAFL